MGHASPARTPAAVGQDLVPHGHARIRSKGLAFPPGCKLCKVVVSVVTH